MGIKNFQAEVEQRLGYKLQPARPFNFTSNIDEFGWITSEDGKHHYTTFIENGRVQDEPEKNFRTGLREIAKVHKGDFKLTANQHIIISNVTDRGLPEIKRLLAEYKLDNLNHSGLRLSSSACVSFPTCGMFRFSQNPCENEIDERRSVVFRARHGRIRTCTYTIAFQYLTLAPDFRPVFAGVDRESGEDVRGKRFTQRLYRNAYDRMSQWLCSTLSWRWVLDALDAQHRQIC
jgi:hypothetical protein